MARTDPQVNFRIPDALKAALEGAATAAGRSLTAEIVQRLEASFQRTPTTGGVDIGPFVERALEVHSTNAELLQTQNDLLAHLLRNLSIDPPDAEGRNAMKEIADSMLGKRIEDHAEANRVLEQLKGSAAQLRAKRAQLASEVERSGLSLRERGEARPATPVNRRTK